MQDDNFPADATTPDEENASLTQLGHIRRNADADIFLQDLVNLANHGDICFNVTLQVAGLLVAGRLTSGKEYFEYHASELFSYGGAEWLRALLKTHEDSYNSLKSEPDLSPIYIHLKDAHIFHDGDSPVPSNRGLWWRGRLCNVDAFWIGELTHKT